MQYVNWGYKFGVLQMEYECVMCCVHTYTIGIETQMMFLEQKAHVY